MAENNIIDACKDSHIATVGGLNTVYHYLLSRIKTLDDKTQGVFNIKGSVNYFYNTSDASNSLLLMTSNTDYVAENGDIRNVKSDTSVNINNQNFLCIQSYFIESNKYWTWTYSATTDTTKDSSKTYYALTPNGKYTVYTVEATQNPQELGLFERTKTPIYGEGTTQITTTNINPKGNNPNYWKVLWDDLGGTYGVPTDNDLGVVKTFGGDTGKNIVINGVLSNIDNATIQHKVDINDSTKRDLYVRTASTDTLGIVKNGTATTIGTGGAVNVNVDNSTIEINSSNQLHVKTAEQNTLGIVKNGTATTIGTGGAVNVNVDGTTIEVKNNNLHVLNANGTTLGTVSQGDNTQINSNGVIRVPYANETFTPTSSDPEQESTDVTIPGVVIVGDKINYNSSTHTINLSEGNAISIGTGNSAGQISVLYDGATIQKTTDNTNKLYARTAGPGTLGVVKVASGNTGTIQVVMTEGENPETTGELVARTASTDTLGIVKNGIATAIGAGGAVNVVYDSDTLDIGNGAGEGKNGKPVNALFVKKANGSTSAGIVYQGDYVTIASDGKISAKKSSTAADGYGVVKVGSNINLNDGEISIESLELGSSSEEHTLITVENTYDSSSSTHYPAVKIKGRKTSSGNNEPNIESALYVDGDIRCEGYITAGKVFHAVWNDIADAIEVQDDLEVEPGFCYMFDGRTYKKTEEYCQKGIIGIHSDTAGDILGKKGKHKELDIAIGGFVLAHVDDIYESGTPLTCGPDGCLTEMKREDVREYPERLVATYWKPEQADFWGPEEGQIAVNGRDWVKIK